MYIFVRIYPCSRTAVHRREIRLPHKLPTRFGKRTAVSCDTGYMPVECNVAASAASISVRLITLQRDAYPRNEL